MSSSSLKDSTDVQRHDPEGPGVVFEIEEVVAVAKIKVGERIEGGRGRRIDQNRRLRDGDERRSSSLLRLVTPSGREPAGDLAFLLRSRRSLTGLDTGVDKAEPLVATGVGDLATSSLPPPSTDARTSGQSSQPSRRNADREARQSEVFAIG